MTNLDLKSELRQFLEAKGIRFEMDPMDVDAELQKAMPRGRFEKYLQAAFARNSGGGDIKEIYRAMSTQSEANTLISEQAEVYLDTNAAVLEKVERHLKPGSTIWEMGCMNGLCAEWLAENHPEIHVYGTDRAGQVLRDASKKHALRNLEYLVWDYSTSMPNPAYRQADIIYCVNGVEEPVNDSAHHSTDPSDLRESEYYKLYVQRYQPILERWGGVCSSKTLMVIVLRLPGDTEKLAVIDALSAFGWNVDLSASTHVYSDRQSIPLLVAERIDGHPTRTVPITNFLEWAARQHDLNPNRDPNSAYEGAKAILAYEALRDNNVLHRDSRTYDDGHTMHIEIGKGDSKGYIFAIATTGYLKFKDIPEDKIEQCTTTDLNDLVMYFL